MTKFAHLSKYDPKGKRVWYALPIAGAPELELKHAGMENKPYAQAVAKANQRSGAARRSMSPAELAAANLNIDRAVFPEHVITGWRGIVDADGEEVPFSVDNCRDLLAALPDWIVQGVSIFAGAPRNFLEDDEPTDEEVLDQAGE